MLNPKRFLAPIGRLRKAYLFLKHTEGNTFFLDAAGANRFKTPSQAIRIHSRGRADRLEIAIVVKKKMFRLAAETERPADPFFQSFCDHGAPKSFLRRGPVVGGHKGIFKHVDGPQLKFVFSGTRRYVQSKGHNAIEFGKKRQAVGNFPALYRIIRNSRV
jgi:hypothetical protein